jgi:hypothetical protein
MLRESNSACGAPWVQRNGSLRTDQLVMPASLPRPHLLN